jgi:dihydroorotate dehydrogenase
VWEALGFGFMEIGTVTAKAQPGNPKPRIFRLPNQQALINRLGFNNDGADAIAERLRRVRKSGRWPGSCRIGINIGRSKVTPLGDATEDYLYSFRLLREFSDYITLNVSSPNTPGLRALQEPGPLAQLLRAIREENPTAKPVLVKIAPDLSSSELEGIVATCEQHGVAGIIATNTTLDHSSIPPAIYREGGLSGAPLRKKSTALVRSISARSTIPVIASGGIFDAKSAREKFEAGAQLLQVYTGYIYRGPRLLREILEALP